MKVAVTGGAGFVGSAIVRELIYRGHDVVAIDNLSTGTVANLDGIPCDFIMADAGSSVYRYDDVDAVVHCAAHADISANWHAADNRDLLWREGPELTRRLLNQFDGRRRPFILLSTCAVYGGGWCNEASPTRATSPYAASKIAAEALVQAWDEAGRIQGTILRLVSAVGPRYAHGHIKDFVRMALADDGARGHIHALDNGHHRKSFVHVLDVADAVANCLNGAAPLSLYNVTSSQVWSWPDTVAVMRAMRPDLPFDVTCKDDDKGWTGDPVGLQVTSLYRKGPQRSVVDGVREALEGLGWNNHEAVPHSPLHSRNA